MSRTLRKYGFRKRNTLVATSLCSDNINKELEKGLKTSYGDQFSMGGLAGFPFGGVSAFCEMVNHIPTNGNCIVIFGPHIGVDADGVVGKVNRRGCKHSGICCESAAVAASYVSSVRKGVAKICTHDIDPLDIQQSFVGNILLQCEPRVPSATDPAVELSIVLYEAQRDLMHRLISSGCGDVEAKSKIALLGGIQVNTPSGIADYFVPLSFKLIDNRGDQLFDLIDCVQENRSDNNQFWLVVFRLIGICFLTMLYVHSR
jgi:hypothetical protein